MNEIISMSYSQIPLISIIAVVSAYGAYLNALCIAVSKKCNHQDIWVDLFKSLTFSQALSFIVAVVFIELPNEYLGTFSRATSTLWLSQCLSVAFFSGSYLNRTSPKLGVKHRYQHLQK